VRVSVFEACGAALCVVAGLQLTVRVAEGAVKSSSRSTYCYCCCWTLWWCHFIHVDDAVGAWVDMVDCFGVIW